MKNNVLTITKMLQWSGSEKRRIDDLLACNTEILVNGQLLVSRAEVVNQEKKVRKQIYQDIDKAIRGQNHIILGYLGDGFILSEKDRLRNDQITLIKARQLLTTWRDVDPENIIAIQRSLTRAKEDLDKSRNDYKKATRDQLLHLAGFRDKRGQINPGAMATRATAGIDRLTDRQSDIFERAAYAAKQKICFINEKEQMELNLTAALYRFKFMLHSFDLMVNRFGLYQEQIDKIIFLLRSVWLLPYLTDAARAMKLLTKAKFRNTIGKERILQKAYNNLPTTFQ